MTLPVTSPDPPLTHDIPIGPQEPVLFWVGRAIDAPGSTMAPRSSQRFPELYQTGSPIVDSCAYQVVNIGLDATGLEKFTLAQPISQSIVLLIDDTVEFQAAIAWLQNLTALYAQTKTSGLIPVVLLGVGTASQAAALLQQRLPQGIHDVVALDSEAGLRHRLQMAFQVAELRSQNRDLTDQVHNLDRLNLLKDEFIGTVVHELRTPITNMKVAGQLVEAQIQRVQQALGEEIQSDGFGKALIYLQTLKQECERETVLINNLLDLQSIESGSYTLDVQPIDVESWLAQVIEPFRHRVQTRQLNLELQILDTMPPLISSAMSLERVLNELLHNACKYTPPGETIQLMATLPSPEILELTVKNTGVEIPLDEQSRVFEKFYRVPSSDRWKQGGTGLGLALVKQLMINLGGEIQLHSGCGATRFILHLPLDHQF